jgi:hypothetical protein
MRFREDAVKEDAVLAGPTHIHRMLLSYTNCPQHNLH